MKIGVISDTHDKLSTAEAAFSYFAEQQVRLVVHCGDWKSASTVEYIVGLCRDHEIKLKGVLGNNDLAVTDMLAFDQDSFEIVEGVLYFTLDNGKAAAVYHGHHKPTLRNLLLNDTLHVIFLGHTHKPVVTTDGPLIINPGSTAFAIPRSKTWQPSVVVLDTATMKVYTKYLQI